jgi:hypothetical protein
MSDGAFVGMFDIVGFRGLRNHLGTAGLYQLYQRSILPLVAHAAAGAGETVLVGVERRFIPKISDISCKFRIFSDTAVLLTQDSSFASFLKIVRSSLALLHSGFCDSKAPYRGAIGYGDVVDDERNGILIGSAIEDAYVGEQSQMWSGCALTPAACEVIRRGGYLQQLQDVQKWNPVNGKIERWIVEYPVPVQNKKKDGPTLYSRRPGLAIDWTTRMYEGAAKASFLPSDDEHARMIVANTVEFEEWARAK